MAKQPANQDQHVIPRVYLKQFGYQRNSQWFVTVTQKDDGFTRQKSVGSFTARTNYFDILTDNEKIKRINEELNGEIESEYPKIIENILINSSISVKSRAFIIQIIGNLISRSDIWRKSVHEVLIGENRSFFTKILLLHRDSERVKKFDSIENDESYKHLNDLDPNENINIFMLLYADYLIKQINYFDVIILKAIPDRGWFTSDNPVVIDRNLTPPSSQLLSQESNIFFPLSQNYLAFLHNRDAYKKFYPSLCKLEKNRLHNISTIMFDHITNKILMNWSEFKIFPGKYQFSKDENRNQPNSPV